MDRGAWQATVHGVARVGHDLVTKPPPSPALRCAGGNTRRGPQTDLTVLRAPTEPVSYYPEHVGMGMGAGRQLWEAEEVPRQPGGLPRGGSNNICTY